MNDVKFTVSHAVEPIMEQGTRIKDNIINPDKRTKDDSSIPSLPPSKRIIRGIDDPLLYGSISDSGISSPKLRTHRRRASCTSFAGDIWGENGSSGKVPDNTFEIRGKRWITKDSKINRT